MRQLFSSIPGQVLDFILVLVGIALIFRQYIFGFVEEIIENIVGDPLAAIRDNPLHN